MDIDYNTVYDRDIRFYNNCVNGFIKRRETSMNDMQAVGDRIASRIAQKVWGNKEANKPLENIRFNDDTNESRNDKVMRNLKAKGVI